MIPFSTVQDHTKEYKLRGVKLAYPSLTKPDAHPQFGTNFRANCLLSDEEKEALEEAMTEVRENFMGATLGTQVKKTKSGPKMADFPIDETEDGSWFCKAKLPGFRGKDKDVPVNLLVVDADRKPIPSTVNVGGGSVANVILELRPYYMASGLGYGVSARLKAVQVLELRNFGDVSAEDAFDKEDGYSAPEETEELAASSGDF
jgi:hypothetical protein